jgi:hypothetical protein
MPRRIRDLVATIVTLLIIFAVLIRFSPEVRDRAKQFVSSSQEWSAQGNFARHTVVTASSYASGWASDNTYLFSLVVVAVVLLALMLRT